MAAGSPSGPYRSGSNTYRGSQRTSGSAHAPEWVSMPKTAREEPAQDRPLLESEEEYCRGKGIEFIQRLGRGGYGEVWLTKVSNFAEDENGFFDIELACKTTRLKRFEAEMSLRDAVLELTKESDMLRDLDHPHIVRWERFFKLYDKESDFEYPICVLTFLELCHYTLRSMHKRMNKEMPEVLAASWFTQIAHALRYLHEDAALAHFDIKPANILIKEDYDDPNYITTKLSDFGLAKWFRAGESDETSQLYGTAHYRPPEIVAQNRRVNAFPCDIYSLAVTLAETIVTVCPKGTAVQYCTRIIEMVQSRQQFPHLSPQLQDLLYRMTRNNPVERITIAEVVEHEWTRRGRYRAGDYFKIQ